MIPKFWKKFFEKEQKLLQKKLKAFKEQLICPLILE